MRTIDLKKWTEFPIAIQRIREEYEQRLIRLGKIEKLQRNTILFRGQANSDWKLQSTLERVPCPQGYSVKRYLQRADSVVNEIESVTEKKWGLKTFPDICKEIEENQDSLHAHLPCYEYLVYLRHHGFPSPLLDWTSSPYVAAYFAFESMSQAERCSVYAYIETTDGGKMRCSGEAGIYSMGPYITTSVRHFAQKAQYTIATRWDHESKNHFFCSHHDISPARLDEQDILIKITIPTLERIAVLRQLEDYNINQYTLFQSEDSLIRALGIRAFDLEEAE